MPFVPSFTAIPSDAADARPTAVVMHGILGSRGNWRSVARRMARRHPRWRWVTVDLRNHGESSGAPAPHTLAACAADLDALPFPAPEVVVGHSFGGKVALAVVERGRPTLRQAWVLDSLPGAVPAGVQSEVTAVLTALRALPGPFMRRAEVSDALTQQGFSRALGLWMTTNLRRARPSDGVEPGSLVWSFDLDAVAAMMADYRARDLWPVIEAPGCDLHLVQALQSDRWTPEDVERLGRSRTHLHPLDSGHWVHADNPKGLFGLMDPVLDALGEEGR